MTQAPLKVHTISERSIRYSVIIPAYNEESLLPATLANLRLAMETLPYKGEIIVVDNDSTDNTRNIARNNGTRIIFEPFRQIARVRNSGARAARGDFLVFLDADSIPPPPLLQQALTLMDNGCCCGGGSLLKFDSNLPFLADSLVRFWNWLSRTNRLAAGSFVFSLAQGFFESGGFDEKIYAGEEILFSRRISKWGRKHNLPFIILEDYPVITSARKFHWYSSLHLALLLLFFTIFPLALRSRSLCKFWYSRPGN